MVVRLSSGYSVVVAIRLAHQQKQTTGMTGNRMHKKVFFKSALGLIAADGKNPECCGLTTV